MLEKEVINFEKTAIVGIVTQNQSEEKLREYLDELEFLTFTAGGQVVKRFSQKMERPNPKTFVGTGKIEEIHQYVKENEISTLIFDDELSPSQQKNISKVIEECKILDRTHLILDIFAQRAETSYARTQVELAQCQYFYLGFLECGLTLSVKKGELECVDLEKQKLKQTDVLYVIELPY